MSFGVGALLKIVGRYYYLFLVCPRDRGWVLWEVDRRVDVRGVPACVVGVVLVVACSCRAIWCEAGGREGFGGVARYGHRV